MIRLISIRGMIADDLRDGQGVKFVYIGRGMFQRGVRLHKHALHNPFRIGKDGDAKECCRRFRVMLQSMQPAVLASALDELFLESVGGQIPLACWCGEWRPGRPEIDCHGVAVIQSLIERYPSLGVDS